MKLKTNLFQGKKPCLEEGRMIYTINDEDTVINGAKRSRGCRLCLQFMKVIFYVLLLFFILFLIWIGFVLVSQALAPAESRGMCGTGLFYDYIESMDSAFNSTEVDDMTMNNEQNVINALNALMGIETSTDIDESSTADVKSVTYTETKDYVRPSLLEQILKIPEFEK